MTEEQPAFVIDGVTYEAPAPESLTTADLMLPYRYATRQGITGDPPAICEALAALHIAIARARPGTPAAEIEEKLLAMTVAELEGVQKAWVEDEADPPPTGSVAETVPPETSSSSASAPSQDNGHQPSTGESSSDTGAMSRPVILP